MGEHRVHDTSDEQRTRTFVRAMLDDIRALEVMIERDMIERGVRRVGVEQEMYIVDANDYPAPVSDRVLENIADPRFGTELARFNLEANLDPQPLGGDFLRVMESGLERSLLQAERAANAVDARIVLTGILPTLQDEHVTLANLTPEVRYQCLNDTCMAVRGERFTLVIDGVDHFESSHDCAVVEGASTSFQFHLQVDPDEAGPLYNLAQLITAPILAAAANSPVLLNRRVWHETRVALFERTFEYRSTSQLARDFPTRVGFGEAWVADSIMEIFLSDASGIRRSLGRRFDYGDFSRKCDAPSRHHGARPGRRSVPDPERGNDSGAKRADAAQRHRMALEPALLRYHGRQAAPANRKSCLAGRPDNRRPGGQRRAVLRFDAGHGH
jgi:hypothetical protein